MIRSFLVSRSGLTIETCRIMLSIYANWREQRIQVPLTFNALLLQRIATDKPCLPPYPTLTTRHVSRGHHHLTTPLDILVLQSRQATRTIDHYFPVPLFSSRPYFYKATRVTASLFPPPFLPLFFPHSTPSSRKLLQPSSLQTPLFPPSFNTTLTSPIR
jgi:hypothetical protein